MGSELLPALIMPSLCTKPQENGATPPDTSLQAALAIVEKKVRNLEKRKGKLDAYRDTLQRGKTLNEDQPQQSSQSQSPQSRPAGYAAAAGGNNKQPDTEI